MPQLPEWWTWDLLIARYARMRMLQRGLTEIALRTMLEEARAIAPGQEPGRWVLQATVDRTPWAVVLEPDFEDRRLVVVTVFSPSVLE